MRILYIGEATTHELYLKGNVPSHWFYGAVEMEQDGHDVIWAQESTELISDIKLILSHKFDLIFIPNLNLHHHVVLLLLAALNLYKKPIYAYLHHEPQTKNGIKSKIYQLLLHGVRHIFFLSEKSLDVTVKAGLVSKEKCSVPGWGPDMNFYQKIKISDNGWFVSTGKENRDFQTLIEAFRITEAPLHIITAKTHSSMNYESLLQQYGDIQNIKISILDNSSSNYPLMLNEMASAKAIVCPLLTDKLNYCVGLSTIADAEGLNKPLIITINPYHDNRPVKEGALQVLTVEDWTKAIMSILSDHPQSVVTELTMAKAYSLMKRVMGL